MNAIYAWLKAENRYKPPKPAKADTPQPAHNRASRRKIGLRATAGRSTARRRAHNAQRQPAPWKTQP